MLIVLFSDTIGASLLCMALGEEIVVLCWLKRSSSEHHGTSIIFVHFLSFYDTLQSFPALNVFLGPIGHSFEQCSKLCRPFIIIMVGSEGDFPLYSPIDLG